MLLPVVSDGQSDSACLDNMIELLTMTGRSLPHVMMMLIPEAWDGNEAMDPVKKHFMNTMHPSWSHGMVLLPFHLPMVKWWCQHSTVMDFAPSRYTVTTDDRVIMANLKPVHCQSTKLSKGKRPSANPAKCLWWIWNRAESSAMMN